MADRAARPILVIDDDPEIRKTFAGLLKTGGYQPISAATVSEGLRLFAERCPAAVLLDLRLPGGTGLDVLREMQRQSPGTPVVMVSGVGSVAEAVETMRFGAADYVEKPLSRGRLLSVLDRVLKPPGPTPETEPAEADGTRYGMVGRSEALRRIHQLIEMAAPTKCRVFISGESGTGKELIARAIHAVSRRRDKPFVELNCAAVPADLIESEMFGHVKGAFTGASADRVGLFEAASGGTLFLDEIGDMSLMTQARLLRALQEGQITPVGTTESRAVDCRIISATAKNIPREIAGGTFREDLYHRINVLTINVPPLRERREDIPEVAEHFLRLACIENGKDIKRLAPRAVERLSQMSWPGNLRELRNLMERLVVLVPRPVVTYDDVISALRMQDTTEGTAGPLPLREARARFERDYILERLAANQGSLGRTARDLAIERTNLYRKMKQLGIASPARGR